jgi:hypothetical protein
LVRSLRPVDRRINLIILNSIKGFLERIHPSEKLSAPSAYTAISECATPFGLALFYIYPINPHLFLLIGANNIVVWLHQSFLLYASSLSVDCGNSNRPSPLFPFSQFGIEFLEFLFRYFHEMEIGISVAYVERGKTAVRIYR